MAVRIVSADVPLPSRHEAYPERRKLLAELAEIPRLIAEHHLTDPMSHRLHEWHDLFIKALRVDEISPVETALTTLLVDILHDPLSDTPLDEEALLGSDGRVYGKRSLALYYAHIAPPYRFRSPLAPEDNAPFTVEPHPLVRHLVQWLQKRGAHHPSPAIETAFSQLGAEPFFLPTAENFEREQVRARLALLQGEDSDSDDESVSEQLEARVRSWIEQQFTSLNAERRAQEEALNQRLALIEQASRAAFETLQKRLEEAKKKATELQERNQKLKAELLLADASLSAAERDNRELRLAIEKTRQDLNEQRAASLSGLAAAIGVIAACALSPLVFQAMGISGVGISPLSGGGAALHAVIAL